MPFLEPTMKPTTNLLPSFSNSGGSTHIPILLVIIILLFTCGDSTTVAGSKMILMGHGQKIFCFKAKTTKCEDILFLGTI